MEDIYRKIFSEILHVSPEEAISLSYQGVTEWDSVGHMALVAKLEEEFEITLDIDDVIDFDSYETGKTILSRYGISF